MYAFIERNIENAVMIFRFDETQKAIATLTANHFKVLSGKRVYKISQ
jgi:hypothetical protein